MTELSHAILFKATDDDGDIFVLDQSTIGPAKDIDGQVYLAQIITAGKETLAVRLTKDDLCALQERLTEWRQDESNNHPAPTAATRHPVH